MAVECSGHCAVAAWKNNIYILGGADGILFIEVFDAALLYWKTAEASLHCDGMPDMRENAAAIVLLRIDIWW